MLSLARNAVWAISNLCRGKPVADFHRTKVAIPIIAKLLLCVDPEVRTFLCRCGAEGTRCVIVWHLCYVLHVFLV